MNRLSSKNSKIHKICQEVVIWQEEEEKVDRPWGQEGNASVHSVDILYSTSGVLPVMK
jgi:hypothetical protein